MTSPFVKNKYKVIRPTIVEWSIQTRNIFFGATHIILIGRMVLYECIKRKGENCVLQEFPNRENLH